MTTKPGGWPPWAEGGPGAGGAARVPDGQGHDVPRVPADVEGVDPAEDVALARSAAGERHPCSIGVHRNRLGKKETFTAAPAITLRPVRKSTTQPCLCLVGFLTLAHPCWGNETQANVGGGSLSKDCQTDAALL